MDVTLRVTGGKWNGTASGTAGPVEQHGQLIGFDAARAAA
jgi:hypothetical protein